MDCLNLHSGSQPLLKIGAWAISNLCDGQRRKLGEITYLAELLGTVRYFPLILLSLRIVAASAY